MTKRTASEDPVIRALRNVEALRSCPARRLRRLVRLVERVEVPAGCVLMREGAVGREAFVIVEGTASVIIRGETVASVGPGEFVGEISLSDLGGRTATVSAETPMKLLAMGAAAWASFVAHPDVARAVQQGLAARLRRADEIRG